MSKRSAAQGLIAAYVGLIVIQGARSVSAQGRFTMPRPSIFVAPAVLYSVLSLVAAVSAEIAVALAVGIDLATAVAPNTASAVETTVAKVLHANTFIGTQTAGATSGADAKSGYRSSSAPAPVVQGVSIAGQTGNLGTGAVPMSSGIPHYQ